MTTKLKILSLCLLLACMFSISASSQSISISADPAATADASAILDIQSNSKGLLVPRMTAAQRLAIATPAKGLLVFQTDADSGFYYNSGSKETAKWISFQSQLNGWSTKGNAGMDTATHFIGTTDVIPIVFRHNNVRSGLIDSIRAETALGYRAMIATSTGAHNAAFGYKALESNTEGGNNVGIGSNALRLNTTGSNNAALGFTALRANTTGINNTAFGSSSLSQNTTGSYNHASGYGSLAANLEGSFNTAVGNIALVSNTVGSSNAAVGSDALRYNISGSGNVGVGYTSLYFGNTGNNNTGVGAGTLFNNASGYSNVAIGVQALFNTGNRSNLVAIGDSALYNNGLTATQPFHGTANVAIGSKSLYKNTIGSKNTGLGYMTLNANTTGEYNTAAGTSALSATTTGYANTAIGSGSLLTNTSGIYNTALGFNAGPAANNLQYSTAIGAFASVGCSNCLVLGNGENVGIGTSNPVNRLDVATNNNWDLTNTEGDVRFGNSSYRLKIGVALGGAGAGSAALMQYGNPGGYNVLMLGSQGNGILFLNGNTNRVGIGTDNPSEKLSVNGNICYTGSIGACSDVRYKTNFQPIADPLQKILSMNGFYYHWKRDAFPGMSFSEDRQLGFSAQEVEKLFPEIVQTNDKGYKSVDYGRLTPVLVEAVKQQQQDIAALKEMVGVLQKEVAALKHK